MSDRTTAKTFTTNRKRPATSFFPQLTVAKGQSWRSGKLRKGDFGMALSPQGGQGGVTPKGSVGSPLLQNEPTGVQIPIEHTFFHAISTCTFCFPDTLYITVGESSMA